MNWMLLLAKINKKADKDHAHNEEYAEKDHLHSMEEVEGMEIIHSGDIDTIIDNALK